MLEPSEPTSDALRAIDLAAYSFDRAIDHDFWARTSTRATMWVRGGEPSAYSYRGGFLDGRVTGPVAGLDPESAALALRAELSTNPGQKTRVDIPGSTTALVQVAIDAGLGLTNPGLLFLSGAEQPPTAYAIYSHWLL